MLNVFEASIISIVTEDGRNVWVKVVKGDILKKFLECRNRNIQIVGVNERWKPDEEWIGLIEEIFGDVAVASCMRRINNERFDGIKHPCKHTMGAMKKGENKIHCAECDSYFEL